MVEHLAKVAASHPSAARRTSTKMLLFGQIAHAMDNMLPARELNDRAVSFSHVAPPVHGDTKTARAEAQKERGLGNPTGECFLRIVFYEGCA
jgi:hypothetical protein